jgi:hypothetical protein
MDDFGGLFQRLKLRPDPWQFLHAARPLMGIWVQRNPIRIIKYCLRGLFPGKKSCLRFINYRPPGSLEPKIVRLPKQMVYILVTGHRQEKNLLSILMHFFY